jgi:hypothetical protein
MKRFLIPLAAAATLAAMAAPAAAQPYRGGHDVRDRGETLQMRIERNLRRGEITPREAARLRNDVRATERLSWRYRRDGAFTRWERSDIERRYDRIAMAIRYERADRDYGYGRYLYRR